jgi:hypothetical protein
MAHSPLFFAGILDRRYLNNEWRRQATPLSRQGVRRTPNGGAVFSTGSIAWCGSLSHNRYRNNVSRVTESVLRAFASSRRF